VRKNCSCEILKSEAEGLEFAKFVRSLEQLIIFKQFLVTECFLTCSWRFLISNKLEQLAFKLENFFGFRNMQEKVGKVF
jgi:hypothetical protein